MTEQYLMLQVFNTLVSFTLVLFQPTAQSLIFALLHVSATYFHHFNTVNTSLVI
jgi:hypothetical protein